MARIVMKFGGTSMAGTERIRRVANIVRRQAAPKADGTRDQVAVVVSAMAGETDRLINFCREAHALYDPGGIRRGGVERGAGDGGLAGDDAEGAG